MRSDAYSTLLKRTNRKYIFQDELDEINELVDQLISLQKELADKCDAISNNYYKKKGAVFGDQLKLEDELARILVRLSEASE